MKRIVLLVLIVSIVLVAIVLVKTAIYPFAKVPPQAATVKPVVSDSALARFANGLKIPTVSTGQSGTFNYTPFDSFNVYLQRSYPLVYNVTNHYEINKYAHVFIWKGKNTSLEPILFLSHIDVVPPGNAPVKDSGNNIFNPHDAALPPIDTLAAAWDYAPFSGAVANGRIYGRGAMDMKGMLFSLLESATILMQSGFQPARDVYFAFGFDEEVGGRNGAEKIAGDFKNKNLHFDAVYDEGGIVSTKGSISGVGADVALIGCAEKGFLSLKIKVKGLGGHSSTPPMQSAIGKAAIIMQRLENDQMKPAIIPLINTMFKNIGGTMPFANRMALANQWLLQPVLLRQLEKNNSTNALIRTTTALTMMKGSDGTNVLSPEVEFVVNFRLLPGNTIADVREHVKKACEGFDVTTEDIDNTREASDISPTNVQAYKVMEKAIRTVYPGAIISPYITTGGTDAYKYQIVSKNVYRFIPFAINNYEQQTIHSTNEYLSIENFGRMIAYFETVIKNYDAN